MWLQTELTPGYDNLTNQIREHHHHLLPCTTQPRVPRCLLFGSLCGVGKHKFNSLISCPADLKHAGCFLFFFFAFTTETSTTQQQHIGSFKDPKSGNSAKRNNQGVFLKSHFQGDSCSTLLSKLSLMPGAIQSN